MCIRVQLALFRYSGGEDNVLNRRMCRERGRSSVVERQLPKLNVVGSIPIARSNPC